LEKQPGITTKSAIIAITYMVRTHHATCRSPVCVDQSTMDTL